MADISIQNLSVSFGSVKVLDSVSIDFADGGLFALLGPSGSGKTTLLRTIAGFVQAESGTILIDGESVDQVPVEKRDIGLMFQNYALFPNMTVYENIGFGLRVRKVGADEEKQRLHDALKLVQLDKLGHRKPHELSGGQQQRVALARAFVTNPRVLLLDEPLSALDKALRVNMQIELKRIQREIGITTIFVTHDQEEALTLSDKIGILQDGKLVQVGSAREVYNYPRNLFVAKFLGEVNVFDGEIANGKLRLKDGKLIRIPANSSSSHVFAVRPEHMSVSLSEPENKSFDFVAGNLLQKTFKGSSTSCLVETGGNLMKVTARDSEIPEVSENSQVYLCWDSSKIMAISVE